MMVYTRIYYIEANGGEDARLLAKIISSRRCDQMMYLFGHRRGVDGSHPCRRAQRFICQD